jgi:hypothetical protein
MNKVFFGDCRDTMRDLIAQGVKVQMCVTSPPYFGLRDYGHPGQLGLEATPAEYVAAMVEVFALVRELLADDGVLWLNLGRQLRCKRGARASTLMNGCTAPTGASRRRPRNEARADFGLKPKDLIGIPWRVALRAPGGRMVLAAGHHLAQAEPDAGERDRPLHEGARVPVFVEQERAVLLRRAGDRAANSRQQQGKTGAAEPAEPTRKRPRARKDERQHEGLPYNTK